MAKVSNLEELKEALSLESIEQIQVLSSITIDEPIDKTIIIPEDKDNITLNFQGQKVKELIVKGDSNTIKGATVLTLNVASTVENLYLENIQDIDGSEYIFNGGGGESIKLIGNTTFRGNIKIVSGTAVQITAESDDAKIEGTVSVESNAKTTISAPVSNLVVNTKNSQVVINATVDKVAVRYDAKITLKQGVETPRIEARLGTTVTAKNENGEQVTVDVNYMLDIYELRLKINGATNRLESIVEGPYDGNVAEGEKAILQNVLANSKQALENEEITEQNQKDIDAAAEALGQAIVDFDSKIVRVDRWEINQLVQDIYMFLACGDIVIGTEIGNYPQEAYDEFLDIYNATREFLRGDQVTPEEVNIRVKQLNNALKNFNNSKIIGGQTQGTAKFIITGDNMEKWEVEFRGILAKKNETGKWENIRNIISEEAITVNKEMESLYVTAEFDVLDKYSEFTIPLRINNNNYLAFLNMTAEEIRNKNGKEIFLDSFASIDVSINGEENHDNYILYNLNTDGRYNLQVKRNTKIQPGKYSISYKLEQTEIPYYLYTDTILLDGEDKTLSFEGYEFPKIKLELSQEGPYNYTLNKVNVIKYNTGSPIRINSDNPIFYLSEGYYKEISPEYSVDINRETYTFFIFGLTDINVDKDIILEFNDKFSLEAVLEVSENPIITNIRQPLGEFGNLVILNDLGQRVALNEDGHPDHLRDVECLAKITTGDKEYAKNVSIFNLPKLTFAEIIGENNLEKEFILEISIPELPIVSPYIQEMIYELKE